MEKNKQGKGIKNAKKVRGNEVRDGTGCQNS